MSSVPKPVSPAAGALPGPIVLGSNVQMGDRVQLGDANRANVLGDGDHRITLKTDAGGSVTVTITIQKGSLVMPYDDTLRALARASQSELNALAARIPANDRGRFVGAIAACPESPVRRPDGVFVLSDPEDQGASA